MCCWYTEYSQSMCLIHLSTAHDALSPHPRSYSTPLALWECALPVLGSATAAWWSTPHTALAAAPGKGSSSRGWCWRARRRHEDQPGVAVRVVAQARACTQLQQHGPMWWETHLVAVGCGMAWEDSSTMPSASAFHRCSWGEKEVWCAVGCLYYCEFSHQSPDFFF